MSTTQHFWEVLLYFLYSSNGNPVIVDRQIIGIEMITLQEMFGIFSTKSNCFSPFLNILRKYSQLFFLFITYLTMISSTYFLKLNFCF